MSISVFLFQNMLKVELTFFLTLWSITGGETSDNHDEADAAFIDLSAKF
jgi:hypothetical protein